MLYHYDTSGIEGVYLLSGVQFHETPYGTGDSIADVVGLARLIVRVLVDDPRPIDGAALRTIRVRLDLTQREIAERIGADEQAVYRWEKARSKPVPGMADRLVRALALLDEGQSPRALLRSPTPRGDASNPRPALYFDHGPDGWRRVDAPAETVAA